MSNLALQPTAYGGGRIESLDNRMTQRLIFSLRDNPAYIRGADFEDVDLQALPQETVVLSLEGSRVTSQGISQLSNLRVLRCLDLDSTKVTDVCIPSIACLPALDELWLECTALTDAGLQSLSVCKCLRFVSVAYTEVTQAGISLLKAVVPGPEISA